MPSITHRPVTPKGQHKPKGNQPTSADRRRWEKIRALGCAIPGCYNPPEIHHAETGAGRRKDHKKVFPLCATHHTGLLGLHQRLNQGLGRKEWQIRFGTEQFHLDRVKQLLGES